MGLKTKATVGLLVSLILFNVIRSIFQDLAVVQLNQIGRENTAGKRVLVTGSSRGVGEAVAKAYASAGARVVLHARKLESLKEVISSCQKLGAASVHAVTGDLSVPGEAAKVVNAAAEAAGGLDTVVVNHISPLPFATLHGAVESLRSGQLELAMRVNFLSYVEASHAALPHLSETGGSLVLVSSAAGRLPIPYCYEYCYSKRALNAFFSSVRQELAMNKSSVHVGMATLGLIDTESAKAVVPHQFKPSISYAPVDSTARAIAAVSLGRVREVVTPWYIRVPLLLREWAPSHIEKHLQGLSVVM